MTTAPNIRSPMPRKPPAKRLFTSMVGLPHEPEIVAEPASVTTPDVLVQARQIVDALWDAARSVTEEYAPDRDRQVKNAVRDAFSPVKRGRGRPRTPGKDYATEAERKKVEYAAARAKLVLALDAFGVTVSTKLTSELQIKYATTAKTYGQLLRNDPKTLEKIIELLQQESGVVKRRSTTGGVMREAPRGKGKVVTGDYNSTKIDTDQGAHSEEQARLSAPQDAELYGPDSPDSNSILNNVVVLVDGSMSNSDRTMHLPTGGSDNRFDNVNTKETDFTFTNKARWPQSWFTAKYKPEYHEIADECMRQAVNAFSQAKNSEPGFEPGGGAIEISAQYCVLCDDKLSGRFSTIDHFLKTHLAQVQGFFRQAGVQFRRKHFGITEKT